MLEHVDQKGASSQTFKYTFEEYAKLLEHVDHKGAARFSKSQIFILKNMQNCWNM